MLYNLNFARETPLRKEIKKVKEIASFVQFL